MNTMIWVISNNTNEIIIKSACMWFRDRTSRENHIIICILLMAPHSGTLAWKIPWMEDPGRLQSMGLLRVKTRLSNFTFTFHFHALEKEMATHSRVLAWRIPGPGEASGLLSMGSHRVGHDWSDLAATSICQQSRKTQQWPQDWKRSVFIPIPKKGNAKECSNYCTIALRHDWSNLAAAAAAHASEVMLKILQARL